MTHDDRLSSYSNIHVWTHWCRSRWWLYSRWILPKERRSRIALKLHFVFNNSNLYILFVLYLLLACSFHICISLCCLVTWLTLSCCLSIVGLDVHCPFYKSCLARRASCVKNVCNLCCGFFHSSSLFQLSQCGLSSTILEHEWVIFISQYMIRWRQ